MTSIRESRLEHDSHVVAWSVSLLLSRAYLSLNRQADRNWWVSLCDDSPSSSCFQNTC